jgi:hypothetical protein
MVFAHHVDLQGAGADDAALAPATGDQRRVGGHAAATGEDTHRRTHALDVLGVGLFADEKHGLALLRPGHRSVGGEHDLPEGATGAGGETLGDGRGRLLGRRVDDGMEQLVELFRLDPQNGGPLVDATLAQHVHGHVQGRGAGALAGSGLEHPEATLLDGELDVLHVLVVVLEVAADVEELLVDLRHGPFEGVQMLVLLVLGVLVDGVGRAGAGDHVLALGIDQPLTVELVVAGRGVAGEGHAGGRGVTHVAEHHGLDVDCGPPLVRDALDAAVGDGALAVPRREDGADATPQLLHGIVGEILAQNLLDGVLETPRQRLQILGRDVGVGGVSLGLLELVEHAVELLADALALGGLDAGGLFHHHVGIHHDQPAVGVPHEARVAGLGDHPGDRGGAEAHVEHRLHHARHGHAGAGAHRDQERVLGIAELRAHDLLDCVHGTVHLVGDAVGVALAILVVVGAEFGGEGEARRHRDAEAGHLGQIGALSTEQVLHPGSAVGGPSAKRIDVLLAHSSPPSICSFDRSARVRKSRPRVFNNAIRLVRTAASSAITRTSRKN